jgi:hypothetical protein
MVKTKRPGIDVTVVQFYKANNVPQRIHVPDISTPLVRKIPAYITGLSGHQRLDGMMYARQYADAKGLEMIVVDLLVAFDHPLYPKVMPPELVKQHDVLSMYRISKDLVEQIAGHWKEWVAEDEGTRAVSKYDWGRTADFVGRRPDLLPRLLALDEFKHINLITHPALTSFHDMPLTATSFRVGYPRIVSASARFHPDIELSL